MAAQNKTGNEGTALQPKEGGNIGSNYVQISFVPTIEENDDVRKARQETASFRQDVNDAGKIRFGQSDQEELKPSAEGYSEDELYLGIKTVAEGGRSKDLQLVTEKAGFLNEAQKEMLVNASVIAGLFEAGEPEFADQLFLSAQQPQIVIEQFQSEPQPQPGRIILKTAKDIFSPVIDYGKKVATKKIKKFGKKALKKGAKKLGKKFGKTAAKQAVKVAAKVGVKVGAKLTLTAIGQAIGTSVPIIGNIIAFIITDVIPRVIGAVVKITKKIFQKLRDNKELVALAALVMLGGGALVGNIFSLLGGAALGVFAWQIGGVTALIGTVTTALIVPMIAVGIGGFLVFFFFLALFTILVSYIIYTSSYLVPYNPLVTIPGVVENPYIGLEKVPDPTSVDNPPPNRTITYTITITAQLGALSNITFNYECRVVGTGEGTPCPDPVPPDPPLFDEPDIITPADGPYVITYQVTYDSKFNDSIIVDTFTVTADAPSAPGQVAAISASVVIGNPPIDCPLMPYNNMGHKWASYTPGDETRGHGSDAYWAGGVACEWSLPQSINCWGPTSPAASGNVCFSEGSKCAQYGYAFDVYPAGGTDVFAPRVAGAPQTWNCSHAFPNAGGSAGHTYRCTSGVYTLILTHMQKGLTSGSDSGTFVSGQQIGSLFPMGNTHLHFEFAIGGVYQRPEDYFCF